MTSPLGKVSLQDILQKHSLGAEEGAIERDRVTHRVDEAGTISVEKRNDHLVKLVVQRKAVDRSADAAHLSGRVDGPAGDTFNTAFDPPAIKDAQTGHAIDGGFIPLVPDASSGGCGVLSHTSTPAVSNFARSMS
jgi:hypothetical protein